jgi:hypothetical protein
MSMKSITNAPIIVKLIMSSNFQCCPNGFSFFPVIFTPPQNRLPPTAPNPPGSLNPPHQCSKPETHTASSSSDAQFTSHSRFPHLTAPHSPPRNPYCAPLHCNTQATTSENYTNKKNAQSSSAKLVCISQRHTNL